MPRSAYQAHVSRYMQSARPHNLEEARAVVRRAAAAWRGRGTTRRANPGGGALRAAVLVGIGLVALHALGRAQQPAVGGASGEGGLPGGTVPSGPPPPPAALPPPGTYGFA